MRIIQVGGLAGPRSVAGGVWRVATQQTEVLASANSVLLIGGWLGRPPHQMQDHVRKVRLFRPFPGAKLRGLWSPTWPVRFAKVARRADVVHIHLSRDFFTTTALLICHLLNVPVVAQTHGMLNRPSSPSIALFDYFFKRLYLVAVDRWLALTEQESQELQLFGVAPIKLTTIFNAAPDAQMQWVPPDQPQFSFISRLAKRKQPSVFVDAANDYLKTANAKFTIAGNDQGELALLRRQISHLGRDADIQIVDELTKAQVAHQLVQSTALILPSVGEIFPVIALEALAHGTPLILTTDSGISEPLRQADAALVIPPRPRDIAAAMHTIASNTTRAKELSANGLRFARTHWSSTALRTTLLEQYSLARGGRHVRSVSEAGGAQ